MNSKLILILSALFILTSCEKDEENFNPPTDYNFENASYSGQIKRLDMLSGLVDYADAAALGSSLEYDAMVEMFENKDGNGGGRFNFNSTKQIADKCAFGFKEDMKDLFSIFASNSKSYQEASPGIAGYVESPTGSKYFVNENGKEYAEIIEKGIMGACFMYQIQNVYLGLDKMTVDNSIHEEGKNYTTMEHHWDEAFGYLGAPIDWSLNTEGERYWAKYAHKMNTLATGGEYDSPNTLIKAFIRGRYAITKKNYSERDKQIEIIRKELEYVAAGTAIHYLNSSLENYTDAAKRIHSLTEAEEFIKSLQFVSTETRMLSNTQIQEILSTLNAENFFEISTQTIQSTKDLLASFYGFENFADQL